MKNQTNFNGKRTLASGLILFGIAIFSESVYAQKSASAEDEGISEIHTKGKSNCVSSSSLVSGYIRKDGSFRLAIDNPDQVLFKIRVMDKNNNPLYEETGRSGSYRKSIDLSRLSESFLKVEVSKADKTFSYLINRKEAHYVLAAD